MSIISSFKTYWVGNTTLTAALPVTSIYLDYVPPNTPFPYCRFTMIAEPTIKLTSKPFINTLTYQLSFFHTDLDLITTLTDTVDAVLDMAKFDAKSIMNIGGSTLINGEMVNGKYTYHIMLQYDWQYMET